jgi:hypothetical protein
MVALKLTMKSVYGNDLFYPSCETSKALAQFRGAKTLRAYDIEQLKRIGYSFEWVAQSPNGVSL